MRSFKKITCRISKSHFKFLTVVRNDDGLKFRVFQELSVIDGPSISGKYGSDLAVAYSELEYRWALPRHELLWNVPNKGCIY